MIIGTGIDIVKVNRVQSLYDKYGDEFLQKIFTDNELAYCKRKKRFIQSLALRFAAKEAFLKSVKTGLSNGLKLSEIEVVNDELGAPHLNLHGNAKKMADNLKVKKTHLSLSDDDSLAVANVILEG